MTEQGGEIVVHSKVVSIKKYIKKRNRIIKELAEEQLKADPQYQQMILGRSLYYEFCCILDVDGVLNTRTSCVAAPLGLYKGVDYLRVELLAAAMKNLTMQTRWC